MYDVVVVGGGHNGLVAAGYLARAGRRVVVCERRPIVGGAAVCEHPFGPDFTVTSLSYVVSLLPTEMVRDLRLTEHGYHVYPQGPYFAPRRDGGYLQLADDPARRRRADREVLRQRRRRRTSAGTPGWAGSADVLGPLLDDDPAASSARSGPATCSGRPRLLRALRKVDVRAAFDLTRLFTASIADLVEERFDVRRDARACCRCPGVIGTWAGPRSAGTAYVMLHHHIGDRTGSGGGASRAAAWAGSPRRWPPRRGRSARRSAPSAPVARIDVRDGGSRGVTLESTARRSPRRR